MIRYKENGTAEKQAKMYQLRIYVEGGNYVVKSALSTIASCPDVFLKLVKQPKLMYEKLVSS